MGGAAKPRSGQCLVIGDTPRASPTSRAATMGDAGRRHWQRTRPQRLRRPACCTGRSVWGRLRAGTSGPAAVAARVEAEQGAAAVGVGAAEPARAEAAVQRAVLVDAVVCANDGSEVVAALELGALGADRACAAERDAIRWLDLGGGGATTSEEWKRTEKRAKNASPRGRMSRASGQCVEECRFHGVQSSLALWREGLSAPRVAARSFWRRGCCGGQRQDRHGAGADLPPPDLASVVSRVPGPNGKSPAVARATQTRVALLQERVRTRAAPRAGTRCRGRW